mmetsp:Transcript_23761/g.58768  ORF Transcript_23761/g.58768 Transcript_23761/m.58768 type:complete len:306 (-) Transcript_23761:53-970(-)
MMNDTHTDGCITHSVRTGGLFSLTRALLTYRQTPSHHPIIIKHPISHEAQPTPSLSVMVCQHPAGRPAVSPDHLSMSSLCHFSTHLCPPMPPTPHRSPQLLPHRSPCALDAHLEVHFSPAPSSEMSSPHSSSHWSPLARRPVFLARFLFSFSSSHVSNHASPCALCPFFSANLTRPFCVSCSDHCSSHASPRAFCPVFCAILCPGFSFHFSIHLSPLPALYPSLKAHFSLWSAHSPNRSANQFVTSRPPNSPALHAVPSLMVLVLPAPSSSHFSVHSSPSPPPSALPHFWNHRLPPSLPHVSPQE